MFRIPVILTGLVVVLAIVQPASAGTLTDVAHGTVRDGVLNSTPPDGTPDATIPVTIEVLNEPTNWKIVDQGIVEFDLSTAGVVTSATLNLTSTFPNSLAGTSFDLYGYSGNGTLDLADWGLGNYLTSFLLPTLNSTVSVDVTGFIQGFGGTGIAGFRISLPTQHFNQIAEFGASGVGSPRDSFPTLDFTTSVVPLPAGAWLGLGLLGALGVIRRRRRRQSA
jgi:hypothetical protein